MGAQCAPVRLYWAPGSFWVSVEVCARLGPILAGAVRVRRERSDARAASRRGVAKGPGEICMRSFTRSCADGAA
eukprot:6724182-Pyramimonas_sp.AAC.2